MASEYAEKVSAAAGLLPWPPADGVASPEPPARPAAVGAVAVVGGALRTAAAAAQSRRLSGETGPAARAAAGGGLPRPSPR